MCVHHDVAKHGCDHLDAVNRTWIHLKKRRLAIRALSWRLQSDDRLNHHLRIVRMPSPVQSTRCSRHHCKRQYGAVCSMGQHNRSAGV
ncbi:hypothetical protein TNCV_4717931 [Trichonephila clavipes]|nr:hypothetical protein TNCV_4717931 [Trichonephila clavipes]